MSIEALAHDLRGAAVGMADVPVRGVQRIEVVLPAPIRLSEFTKARREARRPVAYRSPDFAAQFDDDTLFYDAFRSSDGRIVLCGPPFFNLRADLQQMQLSACTTGLASRFELRELDRHGQIHLPVTASTDALRLAIRFGDTSIAVQPNECNLFQGRRVLFTLSKNNRLDWIKDWIRFSRDIHGADAVLIYDNGSTAYSIDQLAAAVAEVDGIAVARVVSWPFKYGPQGLDARRFWDSDFAQHGAWEHSRRRFLERAASVQVSDVDELVLARDGQSVFDAVERDRFGVFRYAGRWVVGIAGREPLPGQADRRHRDYSVTQRERLVRRFGFLPPVDADRCMPKWSVVPSRCPDRAQWRVHVIGGYLPSRRQAAAFSYRHFREIADNWKYERLDRVAFDPARHEEDGLLARQLAAVRWDR